MTKRDSTEIALEKIGDAVDIASRGYRNVLYKDKVSKETLEQGLALLVEIGDKLGNFHDEWRFSERTAGQLALLREAIDKKLFKTEKLDFNHMQKIMNVIDQCNFAIEGFNAIESFVHDYEYECEKHNLTDCIEKVQILKKLLSLERIIVEKEVKRLKTQLENVNLYYQNFMVSKAVQVAYVSLAVSSLAFLLTILQALHII